MFSQVPFAFSRLTANVRQWSQLSKPSCCVGAKQKLPSSVKLKRPERGSYGQKGFAAFCPGMVDGRDVGRANTNAGFWCLALLFGRMQLVFGAKYDYIRHR